MDDENYLVNPNARQHLKAGLKAKSLDNVDKNESKSTNLENLSEYEKSETAFYQ